MICNKRHNIEKELSTLSPDRSDKETHRCCACAYEQGFACAISNSSITKLFMDEIISQLPESQTDAREGHKNAVQAFKKGYDNASYIKKLLHRVGNYQIMGDYLST